MAGDASLSITPVMKWNFERSCYRWLVTRHPAQFERMDFTAQILQSASRARKAFYECGWAEAKVLIRPSDGKFERTPFFDTIIRRGLRNSTRFDASTLTEEEVEALGMHRDESLGFKLQIRHFRRRNKEIVPRPPGDVPRTSPSPPSQGSEGHPITSPATRALPGPDLAAQKLSAGDWRPASAQGGATDQPVWMPESSWHCGGAGVDASGPNSTNRSMMPWTMARQWRLAERGSGNDERAIDPSSTALEPATREHCWSIDPHTRGGRGAWEGPTVRKVWNMEEMREAAWESCRARDEGPKDGERIKYEHLPPAEAGNDLPTRSRHADQHHDTHAAHHHQQGEDRRDSGRSSEHDNGGGGNDKNSDMKGKESSGGSRRGNIPPPTRVEPRPNLASHVEGRGAPRTLPPQARNGVDGRATPRGSGDPLQPAAGGLLAQGYMRLAAMRDNGLREPTVAAAGAGGVGGDGAPITRGPMGRVSPMPSGPHGPRGTEVPGLSATLTRASDRAVSSSYSNRYLPLISDHMPDPGPPKAARRSLSPDYEAEQPRKRRRDTEGVGDTATDQVRSQRSRRRNEVAELAESPAGDPNEMPGSERRIMPGTKSSTPPPQDGFSGSQDQLAREYAESERQLRSARQALDAARQRFDEATRSYQKVRKMVMSTAAGGNEGEEHRRPAEHKCTKLQSLARSCVSAAADGKNEPHPATGAGVVEKRAMNSERDRDEQDRFCNCRGQRCKGCLRQDSSATASAVVPDDMTDVKVEAEILCGLGKAPLISCARASSPSSSLPSSSSPTAAPIAPPSTPGQAPPAAHSEARSSDASNSKHAAIASLAAAAAAAEAAPPTPPKRDPSPLVKPHPVSPVRRAESPLPALFRAMSSMSENHHRVLPAAPVPALSMEREVDHQTRCFGSRPEATRNGSATREAAGIVAGLRVTVRSPSMRPTPPPYPPRSKRSSDDAGEGYDVSGHLHGSYPDGPPRVFPGMMKQPPGSPSACGETDSDHSDSTNGTGPANSIGGPGDGEGAYQHPVLADHAACSRGRRYHDPVVSWQRGAVPPRGNAYVPPLARLADVAASGGRGGGSGSGGGGSSGGGGGGGGNGANSDALGRFEYA